MQSRKGGKGFVINLDAGDRVLLVEDVIITGSLSKIVEEAGAKVIKMIAVVDRGERSEADLKDRNFISLIKVEELG